MKISQKTYLNLLFGIGILFFPLAGLPFASSIKNGQYAQTVVDSALSAEIKQQLVSNELNLYYPNSVKRFYRSIKFISPWNKQQTENGSTWQALMFIDCVLQYGLCHDDYHPKEITYPELHDILEKPELVSLKKQARFDIMLTDAMLNLINNLHYGKLNPDFSPVKIDNSLTGFRAEQTLTKALGTGGFKKTISDAQPKSKEYADMQYQMYLWTGLYAGDCYEIPESRIRKLAINMERLRWRGVDTGARIEINLPSYTLNLVARDSTYSFKVIVGKPESPSPTLQSHINYFTTSSDGKVSSKLFRNELLPKVLADSAYLENNHYVLYDKRYGCIQPSTGNLSLVKQFPEKYYATLSTGCDDSPGQLVFRFANSYDVSLRGTREKQLFKKEARDFSRGCIGVERAEKLAALLLKYDNSGGKITALHKAIVNKQTVNFNLNQPIGISITYLTNVVKKGEVIDYKDIYHLDNRLEMAFYNTTQEFASQ